MKKAMPKLSIPSEHAAIVSSAGNVEVRLHCVTNASHPGIDAVTKMNSVSLLAMKIRHLLLKVSHQFQDATTPLMLNLDGSIDCPIVLEVSTDGTAAFTPEASAIDKINAIFERAIFAAECMAVGDQAAVLAAVVASANRAEIRTAKSSQTRPVEMGKDGHIYVTSSWARVITKVYLEFLTAAARVNSLGMSVEVIVTKHRYALPVLRDRATKTMWLMVGTRQINTPVTGFFRTGLAVEVLIDGKAKMLKATESDARMLIEADRNEAAVEMIVEVSLPSNPFLGDEESFRILQVLRVTYTNKQEELTLNA